MTMRAWLNRGALAFGVWLVIWGGGVLMSAEVSQWLLALAVFVVVGAGGLVLDAVRATPRASWALGYRPVGIGGSDALLARLEQRIASSSNRDAVSAEIQALLAAAADDRLRTEHGIDRSVDPEGARRVLGDQLDDYLGGAPPRSRGTSPHFLSPLIERIESL